jgi:membrane fusion protein (multidrug efflux system)
LPSQFSRTTRSLTNDTAAYAIAAWLLAAVLLSAWFAWFFWGSVNVYEISKKARIEVQQAAHSIEASIPGRVVATGLTIGREVKAGDLLVELDASSERLRLQEEESRLKAIPPRMESLRKEIAFREQFGTKEQSAAQAATETARFRSAEAQAAVEFAKDNARRLKEESTAGGVAQIEAARAQNEAQKLGAASDAVASDVRRLESDAQTRVSQNQAQIQTLRSALVSLEGDMSTIRATIARLKQDIDKHLVRAPIAGRIGDASPLRVGGNVTPGQKLATVVPSGALMIVADFSPAVLGRIKPGQPARLRLDGFPWAQYGSIDATVRRVASEIRDGQARVEFAVVPAAATNTLLQHGLPGSIEVTVDHASPAVMILRVAGQMMATSPQSPQSLQQPPPPQERAP